MFLPETNITPVNRMTLGGAQNGTTQTQHAVSVATFALLCRNQRFCLGMAHARSWRKIMLEWR